jgi:hypothetical protein
MIIASYDNWYSPVINIDDYTNLFAYWETDSRMYYINFGYQNMFVTLEIRNACYREDW